MGRAPSLSRKGSCPDSAVLDQSSWVGTLSHCSHSPWAVELRNCTSETACSEYSLIILPFFNQRGRTARPCSCTLLNGSVQVHPPGPSAPLVNVRVFVREFEVHLHVSCKSFIFPPPVCRLFLVLLVFSLCRLFLHRCSAQSAGPSRH
jgi:hypothetical protein